MAEKAPIIKGKPDGSNKTFLMVAILFIVISIGWTAYEFLRALTPDEIKQQKEDAKIAKEIENAKKKTR